MHARPRRRGWRHLELLAPQLGGNRWLLGEQYTLADVCYTPFAQFFATLGLAPPPAVAAWAERLLDRPSARATTPTR